MRGRVSGHGAARDARAGRRNGRIMGARKNAGYVKALEV
jgi:hypothetical protein